MKICLALFFLSFGLAASDDKIKADPSEKDRQQKTEDVMSFLTSDTFFIALDWEDKDGTSKRKERHQYNNFSYDDKGGKLNLRKVYINGSQGIKFAEIGSASSEAIDYRINLSTASPVVKIADYVPFTLSDPDRQLPAKTVILKANFSTRSLFKKGDGSGARNPGLKPTISFLAAMMTKEDLEKLNKLPWQETKDQAEIFFVVSPEMAPRLKAALEDLLKAHGVAVSKY